MGIRSGNVSMNVKIYKTIIKSTLIYGPATWKMKEQLRRKIEAAEMVALKTACRH